MRTVALLALAVLAGCRPAPVESCRDPLAGVWRDPAAPGQRYHLVANAGGYEMYALFDTTAPPDGSAKASSPIVYAPVVFDFQPDGDGYRGSRTQRLTRGPQSCAVRTAARLERCGDDSLTLVLERPGSLDWESCEHGPSAGADSLTLARERAATSSAGR